MGAVQVVTLEHKAVGHSYATNVEARATEGVVSAIVSVTGVIDNVNDVIIPGAYAKSLATRRPKVVWSHDWNQPIGRVLHIEEWAPGDPRLPKQTKDGQPWPAAAGALVATMQFNLSSDRGREAFEAVRFYSESGECEWSIGYVATKSVKARTGERKIAELDLYECSPVLFGAAPLSMTLDLKDALGRTPSEDDLVQQMHRLAVDEIDWDEVDSAAAEGLPTVGTLAEVKIGMGAYTSYPQDLRPVVRRHLARAAIALGDPSAVPTSWLAEVKAEGGLDRNRGNAENLRRWYVRGGGAAKIRWGQDGDFMRCVRIAAKHMDPVRAKGYCNLRHQDALGAPPGKGHPGEKGLLADLALSGSLLSEYDPTVEVGEYAGYRMAPLRVEPSVERDEPLEVRIERVRSAVRALLTPPPVEPAQPVSEVSDAGGWVEVVGTWDDHVVAKVHRDGGSEDTYWVGYDVAADGDIVCGEPRPARVEVVVEDPDLDDQTTEAARVVPLLSLLTSASYASKALPGGEAKAGRVLSRVNAERLRTAVQHLVSVLAAAGITLDEDGGEEPDDLAEHEKPDTTAPSALEEKVSVRDPREVLASLAPFLGVSGA
jgi:hypothetical protein